MSNSQQKEKKSFLIFKKNSDMQTVSVVTFFFVIAVLLYQLVSGLVSGNGLQFPSFIYPSNIFNIMQQVSAVGIMALGMTVVMICGGIDLSVGMMTSLVAIFVAKSVMDWGIAPFPAVLLAVLMCIALELIMGFIIAWLNVEAFIITLGGMISCRGIALLICHSQEVAMNQNLKALKTNIFDWFSAESIKVFDRKLNLPIYVLIFIALAVLTWALLKYTRFGRRLYAVGNNPNAAFLSGINVRIIRLLAFAFNGFCVGIGATMQLVRVNTGIITVGQNLEIDVIAAVVIGGVAMSGGKGSVMGAFLGAILMGAISNAMTLMRLQSEWQFLVKGIIIIVAVAAGAISERMAVRKAVRLKEAETKAA